MHPSSFMHLFVKNLLLNTDHEPSTVPQEKD